MTDDATARSHADGAKRAGTAKTAYSDLVAVCAKCAKRQGLAKREVGRALGKALEREHPERRVKVVATGCLGPCPKRFLAVATPASLRDRRVVLLDPALPRAALRALVAERAP